MALFRKVVLLSNDRYSIQLKGKIEWTSFCEELICDLKQIGSSNSFRYTEACLDGKLLVSAKKIFYAHLNSMGVSNDSELLERLLDDKFVQGLCDVICTFYEVEKRGKR